MSYPRNDSIEGVVVLVKGLSAKGQKQYAYALIPVERYEAYKQAEAKGNYNLGEFGIILYRGSGHEPPEEIRLKYEAFIPSHDSNINDG